MCSPMITQTHRTRKPRKPISQPTPQTVYHHVPKKKRKLPPQEEEDAPVNLDRETADINLTYIETPDHQDQSDENGKDTATLLQGNTNTCGWLCKSIKSSSCPPANSEPQRLRRTYSSRLPIFTGVAHRRKNSRAPGADVVRGGDPDTVDFLPPLPPPPQEEEKAGLLARMYR